MIPLTISNFKMHILRLPILFVFSSACLAYTQTCDIGEFEASKIICTKEKLPIELSGFFPYIQSGSGPAKKYRTESWSGNGSSFYPGCGCFVSYNPIAWSGSWVFSSSDFTDVSTKSIDWTQGVCVSGTGTHSNVKAGFGDASHLVPPYSSQSALSRQAYFPGPNTGYSSCTFGMFWEYTTADEELSSEFTVGMAQSRAESFKEIVENADRVQFWNKNFPETAADAAYEMANNGMSRTTPIVCLAERVSFYAEFDAQACFKNGKYLITYYYKKWAVGDTEPSECITKTEVVEFSDAPYRVPQGSGTMRYHYDLEQGQQCKLLKVTARSLEQCVQSEPGDSTYRNGSVEAFYSLGNLFNGSAAGSLALNATIISASLYLPTALQLQAPSSPDIEVIEVSSVLRQVVAPEVIIDIIIVSPSSYELQCFLPSQKGTFSPVSGVYALSGSPYVTHLIENPDSLATNRIRFTETRGASSNETLYTYNSGTGSMALATGNGLKTEVLDRSIAGSTVTEIRAIEDASNQTVSVVQEVRYEFPFGARITERILDPAGVGLTTTNTYYDNAVTDGGAYGNLKLTIEPTGRWARYTFDGSGRPATTVRQFGDSASNSADSSNRLTSLTYGTIADEDGDSVSEELVTTVESLLGQEIGRSYEVRYSLLETVAGESVETRLSIQCTMSGAAWNASTNLVTATSSFVSGDLLGRRVSESHPDGVLTLYEYAVDPLGNTLTTVTDTGEPNGTGTAIVAGTRTVLVETLTGRFVARDVSDIATSLALSSEVATSTDSFGRPTRIDFIDGTYELRSYACCGLDMVTDRQGIVTNYGFNALGQVDQEVRSGITIRRTLDPEGRLLSSTRIGTDSSEILTESHAYDLAGRLSWSKDARDRETTFSESIDGSGHTVKTTTFPDGGTAIDTYFKDGFLLSVSGTASPRRLAYEYGVEIDGAFTKEIQVGDGGGTTEWTKTYVDLAGRSHKKVYADSANEQSYFNTKGQLARQVDADGIATLFAYNGEGRLAVTAIDTDDDAVIDYDGMDRITRTTSEVATKSSLTIFRTTTELWEVDNTDAATIVGINEQTPNGSHVWQTARGLVSSSTTSWDGAGGKTVTVTNPDGVKTIQAFDHDRLDAVTVKTAGNVQISAITYNYDAHGRTETITDARNGSVDYTYFDDDQVESMTTPDPDTGPSGGGYDPQVTAYTYDDAGRVETVVQPDATVVSSTYWPTGQLKRTWGSRTYPSEYTYDSQGRVKTLTTWQDFAGNSGEAVTTWNYSSTRGFLENKRYADNSGPAYTYKASGRVLTRAWARGVTATYSYDGGGILSGVDYSDGTTDVAIVADRLGRPKNIVDESGERDLVYGSLGQLETEDYVAGLLDDLGVHRTFDAYARPDTVTAVANSSPVNSVTYGYNAASQLETVTAGTNTATYTYHANSALVDTVTFKQSGSTRLTAAHTYDKLNRLALVSSTPSSSAAQSHAYTYNAANQRTRATREDNRYWDYGYDALGQVNSAVKRLASDDAILGTESAYTYDDIGNRKTATVNSRMATYSPNGLNQYSQRIIPGYVDVFGTAAIDATVSVNGEIADRQEGTFFHSIPFDNSFESWWADLKVTGIRSGGGPGGSDAVAVNERFAWLPQSPEIFAYDADGNLTSDGRWSYTWDGENRLIKMETRTDLFPPTGQYPLTQKRKLEFGYDAQGRRISKKVSHWGGADWALLTSTYSLYDAWNLVAELDALASNAAVRTYVWGLDLSGSTQGAGGVGGLLFARSHTTEAITCAAGYDGNGNIIAYVDMATGIKSATFEYGAFGETLIAEGVAHEVMPFRFSTKFTDNETGLLYYGFRYYNPATGRWPNRDPLEERGSAHLYAFVDNSPLNFIDPFGLQSALAAPPALWAEFGVGIGAPSATTVATGVAVTTGVIGTGVIISNNSDRAKESAPAVPITTTDDQNKCKRCKPCKPPVGSIAYRVDMPPSPPHNGIPTPHSHKYEMNQSPPDKGCFCFWVEVLKNPLPGIWLPRITPAAGGGIAP